MKTEKKLKAAALKSVHPNISLGKWGEDIALQFLLEHGLRVLERNVRTPDGELDIVVKNAEVLVFVEVKTRRNIRHSFPEEAVNEEKLDHLEAAAGWYLMEHPEFADNWRLDVVTVIGYPGGKPPQIDWFENVVG
jgi:putative endonuclease